MSRSVLSASDFSVPIDQIELAPDDQMNVQTFELDYGNDDGAIDFFELDALEQMSAKANLVSPEARMEMRTSLILKAEDFLATSLTDFGVSGRVIIFEGETRHDQISLTFNSWDLLSEIAWLGVSSITRSMRYFYSPNSPDIYAPGHDQCPDSQPYTTVIYEEKSGQRFTRVQHEEIFSPYDTLPLNPEEFALVASGALDEVASTNRHAWLADFSIHTETVEPLAQQVRTSHPTLVSRFLHGLLITRKDETAEDEKRALWLADQLWGALIRMRENYQRAAGILAEIPNLPFRALLLARSYVESRPPSTSGRFDEILRYLPTNEQLAIRHLLDSLKLSDARDPTGMPEVTIPDQLRPLMEAMAPRDEETEDESEAVRDLKRAQRDRERRETEELEAARPDEKVHCVVPYTTMLSGSGRDAFFGQSTSPGNRAQTIASLRANPLLYQEALKSLGNKSSGQALWRGHESLHEQRPPSLLAGLSSSLRYAAKRLEGDWEAWLYPYEGGGESFRTTLETGMIERARRDYQVMMGTGEYIVLQENKGDGVYIAGFKPSTKFVASWIPLPLSDVDIRMYLPGGLLMHVESTSFGECDISLEAGGKKISLHYKSRLAGRNPDEKICFYASDLFPAEPIVIHLPSGRTRTMTPEQVTDETFIERLKEEISRELGVPLPF